MRDEECIVDVDTRAQNWVSKVNIELNKFPERRSTESRRWGHESIYRVPQSVKDLCIKAYQPQTVSIGPYHHGEQHLESMEEHKQRALLTFLHRSRKPLNCFVDALAPMIEDLKDAYHQLDSKWKQDIEAFMQLMIVDGCFILEMMRATTAKNMDEVIRMGYADNDPVFSNHGKLNLVPYLNRDMLMLENQLPLMLLVTLLVAEDGTLTRDSFSKQEQLNMLILDFFSLPYDLGSIEKYEKCPHILDFYRRSMLRRLACSQKKYPNGACSCIYGRVKDSDMYLRSATKLTKAGIRIEESKTSSLNDISFERGALNLPLMVVNEELETQYLNMIAWERLCVDAGNEVRAFVFFMKSLIESETDVRLLQSRGIIDNLMGSDNYKAVFNLFDSLSRDVVLDRDNELHMVVRQMVDYCQRPLPRCIAYSNKLYDYLTNPWVGLSIVAAIVVFALTAIQTIYTVLAYYR